MSGLHDPMGGSVLDRRNSCPGSYHAEKDLPDEESSYYAERGSDLHDLAEMLGKEHYYVAPRSGQPAKRPADLVGKHRLSRVNELLTEADAELIQAHLDLVAEWWDLMRSDEREIWFEYTLDGAPLEQPLGTTADVIIHGVSKRTGKVTMVVIDLKTGRGIVRQPANNLQIRDYTALASYHFPGTEVFFGQISQPHVKRYKAARWGPEDIKRNERLILNVIERARDEAAPRIPSKAACKYCKARLHCPQRRFAVLQVDDKDAPNDPLNVILERNELREIEHKAAQDMALKELQAGRRVAGYKAGKTKPHEKVVGEIPERFMVAKPMTPAQIREADPEEYERLREAGVLVRPDGEPKLEKDDE